MTVSASTTGSAKRARCSSAPRSRTSANGATRGLAPPSSSSSAASSAVRSSISVLPPSRAARNSPSGFKARRICTSVPGRSLTRCSDEARDDEVERLVAEGQRLLVGLHARGRRTARAGARTARHRPPSRRPAPAAAGARAGRDRPRDRARPESGAARPPAARSDRRPRARAGTRGPRAPAATRSRRRTSSARSKMSWSAVTAGR